MMREKNNNEEYIGMFLFYLYEQQKNLFLFFKTNKSLREKILFKSVFIYIILLFFQNKQQKIRWLMYHQVKHVNMLVSFLFVHDLAIEVKNQLAKTKKGILNQKIFLSNLKIIFKLIENCFNNLFIFLTMYRTCTIRYTFNFWKVC